MAQKIFDVDDLGPVIVSKRKGSKNVRLSINSKGQVRVNIPSWAPYSSGISFIKSRRQWIQKHTEDTHKSILKNGDRIGKSYRLAFESVADTSRLSSRLVDNKILVRIPLGASEDDIQKAAEKGSERALRIEAELLLPQRLTSLAAKHNFKYKSLTIKKLTGRWGSCSSRGQISLSYYLVQLPWELIDYVIIHELVHTRHLNHSSEFWNDFKAILPGARQLQKLIRQYKPVVQPAV